MKYLQTPLIASVSRACSLQRGFTLIELMTVMVIAAVLLAIAVPNLSSFITSSRVRSAENELAAALAVGRSEAVKRGSAVTVTGAIVQAGNEFGGGWTVAVGGQTLRSYDALPTGYTIHTDGGQQTISFGSSGFLTPATAVAFSVCGPNYNQGFTVLVEPSGLTDIQARTCP